MTDVNPAEEQVIIDPSDLRKYRTELPNLADDSDLDPYEYRLLGHYKRVGVCRESLETTAKKCKMSVGQVSEKRQALALKGWVTLERKEMGGKRYQYIIRVVDRWIENFAKYSGLPQVEIERQIKAGSPSPHEGIPSPGERSPSPHEGKKELIKNFSSSSAVFEKYEQEFGALTPMIADAIEDACKTYPAEWVPEAMQIAVKANKRSWKYVEGILKNCKAMNIRPSLSAKEKSNGNNGTGNHKSTGNGEAPVYTHADRAVAERIKKRRGSVPAV